MPIDIDEVLSAYGRAWVEADHDRRLAILETCWVDKGSYVDPNSSVHGRKELADHIGGFHKQMPGARIELTSRANQHNSRIYFSWRMVTNEGHVAIDGVDFGTLADDGRIKEIVGFFGSPPSL